jgi:hypothetical protein
MESKSTSWRLKWIFVNFLQKIRHNKILYYNVVWAVLLIPFCLYCRHDFAKDDHQVVKVQGFINSEPDDYEKLFKLSQINEGAEFEVPKFPFLKKYTVLPQQNKKLGRGIYDLLLQGNELFYKINDSTFSNFSLSTNNFKKTKITVPGNISGKTNYTEMLQALPKGDRSINYWRRAVDDKNDKFKTLYSLKPSDSTFKKLYVKSSKYETDSLMEEYETLLIHNYELKYDDSVCLINYFTNGSIEAIDAPERSIRLKKSKFIGITPTENNLYLLLKSSDTDLTLVTFNPYRFGSLLKKYKPAVTTADTSDIVFKDINATDFKKFIFSNFYKEINAVNTKIAHINFKDNHYLSIVSIDGGKCYVSLILIARDNVELVAKTSFPIDGISIGMSDLNLIPTKGNTIWMTIDSYPVCEFKYKPKGEQNRNSLFDVNALPLNNVGLSTSTWFSADGYCSLVKQQNGDYFFSTSPNFPSKINHEDSVKLQVFKDFRFISLLNAAEPTFVGISNSNRTIAKIVRPLNGKIQISVLNGINWDNQPFKVEPSFDYYYIIILSALVVSMYFIGFTLILGRSFG